MDYFAIEKAFYYIGLLWKSTQSLCFQNKLFSWDRMFQSKERRFVEVQYLMLIGISILLYCPVLAQPLSMHLYLCYLETVWSICNPKTDAYFLSKKLSSWWWTTLNFKQNNLLHPSIVDTSAIGQYIQH